MVDTVRVVSRHNARLDLHVDDMIDDPYVPGLKVAQRGPRFTIHPGFNEVDAGVWEKWKEQHKIDALLTDKVLVESKMAKEPKAEE